MVVSTLLLLWLSLSDILIKSMYGIFFIVVHIPVKISALSYCEDTKKGAKSQSSIKTKTTMEVKEILKNLRERNNLTQDQMAEHINVTRQAVSRWETGQTQPNPEMLKVLSREFGVSINTLLGAPRTLYCQCCGMPLSDDSMISRETDGSFNEDYCKWCYTDGKFTYDSKDALLDFLIAHIPNPDNQSDSERRTLYDTHLSQLKHWK